MDFVSIELARQLVADRRRRLLRDTGRLRRDPPTRPPRTAR